MKNGALGPVFPYFLAERVGHSVSGSSPIGSPARMPKRVGKTCGDRLSLKRSSTTKPLMEFGEKRRKVWYAVLDVPAEVRHIIGKKRLVKSTKTQEEGEARIRIAVIVAGWRKEITKARGLALDTRDTFWHDIRKEYAAAEKSDEVLDGDGHGGILALELRDIIAAASMKIEDREERAFMFKTATLQLPALPPLPDLPTVTPLASLVTDWKASLRLKQKTIDQMHRDVLKMATKFVNLEALQPQAIKAWMDSLLKDEKMTAATALRYGGSYRSFWQYLKKGGTVPMITPDPFEGPMALVMSMAPRTKTERGGKSYTPEQLSKLYSAALAKGDTDLADVIALGAYTGARIEEVCQLTKKTAKDGVFHWGTKTKASKRETPIHPALTALVARLIEASKDGYLVPSSAENKYGVRSDPLSKRFGHLKTSLGYGASHVFHTTRGTLITLMERAGVVEGIAADVVGHDKKTITFGLYSSGSEQRQKLEAISTVAYPAPLDKP